MDCFEGDERKAGHLWKLDRRQLWWRNHGLCWSVSYRFTCFRAPYFWSRCMLYILTILIPYIFSMRQTLTLVRGRQKYWNLQLMALFIFEACGSNLIFNDREGKRRFWLRCTVGLVVLELCEKHKVWYAISKTLAELPGNSEKNKINLVIVLPSFVIGSVCPLFFVLLQLMYLSCSEGKQRSFNGMEEWDMFT